MQVGTKSGQAPQVNFGTLNGGDPFLHPAGRGNRFWMKMDPPTSGGENAVSLTTGQVATLANNEKITPLRAKVIVEQLFT